MCIGLFQGGYKTFGGKTFRDRGDKYEAIYNPRWGISHTPFMFRMKLTSYKVNPTLWHVSLYFDANTHRQIMSSPHTVHVTSLVNVFDIIMFTKDAYTLHTFVHTLRSSYIVIVIGT